MAHPYRDKASSASRGKMHKMTGHSGGGHAHQGGSHFMHVGAHGKLKSQHPSRRKAGGAVHGDGVKPRLDKNKTGYAEGGRTKKKGDTNVTVVMPHGGQSAGPPPPPPMPPPPGGGGAPPMGGAPGGMPPGMPGAGGAGGAGGLGQALGALTGGTGSNPLAGLSRGFKKGGRTQGGNCSSTENEPDERTSDAEATHAREHKRYKRGGKVDSEARSTDDVGNVEGGKNLGHWAKYAAANRPKEQTPLKRTKAGMAKGGRAFRPTAGAATGEGRLEQAKHYKGK